MTTLWKKKVKWFKSNPEPVTIEYDWTHTYVNSKGDYVKCIIIEENKGYADVLNENGVTVFNVSINDLEEIT